MGDFACLGMDLWLGAALQRPEEGISGGSSFNRDAIFNETRPHPSRRQKDVGQKQEGPNPIFLSPIFLSFRHRTPRSRADHQLHRHEARAL